MKKYLAILVILLLLFLCIPTKNNQIPTKKDVEFYAEIKGEVNNPGVYPISKDETLESLINQANGCTSESDLSSLSLQKQILHKDVIVIPKKIEIKKVSLNSATLEELMTLKGIGEAKAKDIIEYREKKSFESIEEIMEIKGIGEKIFLKIKEMICL